MIIPFATPADGELINLNQVVRITDMTNGSIDVLFTNGERLSYSGDAAKNIKAETIFALNLYRKLQVETSQTIVTPDNLSSRLVQ